MVRVVRLERTVSWSQTRRDTNFAIPGYSLFCHDNTARGKNKDFSVCGHSCGQSHFCAVFGNRGKTAIARVARLCGVSHCPVPDTATALPNHAFYQLNYTRIFNFCHDTTAGKKIKVFSVCGHSCGQSRFCAVFGNRGKSSKRRCRKALRRFASPYPGYRHGTPKAGALPTALHPVVKFLPIQTAYVSGLTFILTYILYINTAESAIFFSTRLPHCAAISLSGTALLHISATRYIFNSLNAAKIAVAWYSCM